MRYVNSRFTYLLTYLLTEAHCRVMTGKRKQLSRRSVAETCDLSLNYLHLLTYIYGRKSLQLKAIPSINHHLHQILIRRHQYYFSPVEYHFVLFQRTQKSTKSPETDLTFIYCMVSGKRPA